MCMCHAKFCLCLLVLVPTSHLCASPIHLCNHHMGARKNVCLGRGSFEPTEGRKCGVGGLGKGLCLCNKGAV